MDDSPKPTFNRRANRRQTPKRTAHVNVRRGFPSAGPNLALTLLDLSPDGVRILTDTPLLPGQPVEISLHALWLPQARHDRASVIWCSARADGQYTVGLKFETRLDTSALQSLAYV